jgi:hypothetical protein
MSADLANYLSDGVYNQLSTGPAPAPSGPQTNLVAIVGIANDGDENVPQYFPNPKIGGSIFGNNTTAENALMGAATRANPECSNFLGVRPVDGTQTAATISLLDAQTPTPGVIGTFVRKCSGSFANGATATIAIVSGTLTVSPVLRVTVPYPDGSQEIYNNVVAYATLGDAYNEAAFNANLAAIVNGTLPNIAGSLRWTYVAGASSYTPNIGAIFTASGGTDGSTFLPPTGVVAAPSVAVTGTAGSTQYAYQVVATGDGDASPTASGTTTTGNASLSNSNYNAVTWVAPTQGAENGPITGYKILRQTGGTGPFEYLTTVGPTVLTLDDKGQFTPITYTAEATVTMSDGLLGTQLLAGSTGMYALDGMIGAAQLDLAGNTDPTIMQDVLAFCTVQLAIPHYSFEENISTDEAIATRAEYNLGSPYIILDIDWDQVKDANTGLTLFVPPEAKIAGAISVQPSFQNPGNQQGAGGVTGIIATERTGGGVTIGSSEKNERQSNGLLYLGYMPRAPRGLALGLPHGMMGDGQTLISDVRMLYAIAINMTQRLGVVVDSMMSPVPGAQLAQPAFGLAKDVAQNYLGELLSGGQIAAWSFNLDQLETPAAVAAGFLIPDTNVTTLSSAQFIVNFLQVGRNVQANVSVPGGA